MNTTFVMLDGDGFAMALMLNASLRKLQMVLDSEQIGTLNIDIEGKRYILCFDEDASLKEKPMNFLASIIAGRRIVGDAIAIMPSDFAELPFDREQPSGTIQ